ncbi:substrate-binding periplasmic protein [Bdellovibrio sp.]|uniref:substrate-binding periplasmic protein n=1 Tax=Bdellovibrio sp. TaxID=28201 RepID=UPI0039E4E467
MMDSKDGSVEGLMVEIFEQTIKPLRLKPDYHIFPLRRSVVEMQKPRNIEKFVHLGTALNFKNEISAGVFSDITMITGAFAAYVSPKSSLTKGPSVTVEMLRSYRVAALRGSAVVPILKHSGINPLEVSNIEQLFKVLASNRIDVSLVLDLSGDFYLKDHPQIKIAKVPSSITDVPLSFLIAKSHPHYDKIFPMISENLAKMRLNGDLKKIAERYYGVGQVPNDVLSK